jgi:glycerate dehydrogenase
MKREELNIVVLDGYCFNPGDLSWEALKELGRCTIYDRTPKEKMIERCQEADVILTNKVSIKADDMLLLPRLKYIGVMATGYNIIDIEAAKSRNIIVTNIPAYSTHSVAQLVFAHVLTIIHRIEFYTQENSNHRWSQSADFSYRMTPLMELHSKKMGIIGLGNIGQEVATMAQGLGMKVLAYTRKDSSQLPQGIEKCTLDELFSTCDVISLHCPLTSNTRQMVDEVRLKQMKKTAILINTARGPLVDEVALAQALNKEQIFAAGLDVLSSEPPKEDNPLLHAKNCYITPHIGWATKEARSRLAEILVDNLSSYLKGKTINNVAL